MPELGYAPVNKYLPPRPSRRAGSRRRVSRLPMKPRSRRGQIPALGRSRAVAVSHASRLSVIFFTTASGAGYGLLFLLSLLSVFGLLPPDRLFGLVALGLGAAWSCSVLSSTFHLGRPERAWRAFSQWRSSWLSREGVAAAVATFFPLALFAFGWVWLGGTGGLFGWPASRRPSCAITVACTAMIYASLKTIRQWRSP